MNANSRREFLRALSASLGGALLTVGPLGLFSCSDDSSVANAYSFHALRLGTGKILFDQSPLPVSAVTYADPEKQPLHFIADPMLSNDGQVIFEAYDVNGVLGLYSIQMSFSGRTPVVKSERIVVQVGQTLDGLRVDHIEGVDVSANGVLALVLSVADDDAGTLRHAVYADRHGELSKIAVEGDPIEGGHVFSGIFHDVSIDEENALFVARYLHQSSDTDDQNPSLGLFVVPLDLSALPRLLLQQGDLPISADYPLSGLGLIDLHGQNYVAAGSVVVPNPENTDPPGPDTREHVILLGTLDGRQPIVLAAGTLLKDVVDGSVHIGDQLGTPRIQDGSPLFALLKDGDNHIFGSDGTRASTASKSPSGLTPVLLSPAVPAEGGALFNLQTVVTGQTLDDGSESKRELIHTSLTNVSTLLLTTGDQLVNDARKIWDISFGSFRRHVDIQRRLAALVLFNDPSVQPGSAYPAALIIGIPH